MISPRLQYLLIFCSLFVLSEQSYAGCNPTQSNFFSSTATEFGEELGVVSCSGGAGYRILYCDTSGGRTVLSNGDYGKKYCRWIAVMDIQAVNTCCTWHNGVMMVKLGKVICLDGTVSKVCSLPDAIEHKRPFYQVSDDSVPIPRADFLE